MRKILEGNKATGTLLCSVSACPFIGQETVESREAKISSTYSTRKLHSNLSKIVETFAKALHQKNHVASCKMNVIQCFVSC